MSRWLRRAAAVPLIVAWLVLRTARLPVNFALWAVSLCLENLLTVSHERFWFWPGWRELFLR